MKIKISNLLLQISEPYQAGRQLNEAEASILNWWRANSIRNSLTKKFSNDDFKIPELRDQLERIVAEKDKNFEFRILGFDEKIIGKDSLALMIKTVAREVAIDQLPFGANEVEIEVKTNEFITDPAIIEESERRLKIASSAIREEAEDLFN